MPDHPQSTVTTAFGTMELDEAIAPLMVLLHGEGISTDFSCQGNPWTPQLPAAQGEDVARAWAAAQHSGDPVRKIEVMHLVASQLGTRADWDHAYVSFTTPGDARRFHQLVLAATTPDTHPDLAGLHERAAATPWASPSRWTMEHTFGGLQDLLAYAASTWQFEAAVGYPDPFAVRFVVRFPHEDVAALATAIAAHLVATA